MHRGGPKGHECLFWKSIVFEGVRFQYIDTLSLVSDRLSGSTGFFNPFSHMLHVIVIRIFSWFEMQINSNSNNRYSSKS